MNSQPILEVKNLVKIYGHGSKSKLAVDNISLSIPKGSFFWSSWSKWRRKKYTNTLYYRYRSTDLRAIFSRQYRCSP